MDNALKTVIEDYLTEEHSTLVALFQNYIERNNPLATVEESSAAIESFLFYELPQHPLNGNIHEDFHKFITYMAHRFSLPFTRLEEYGKILQETERLFQLRKEILQFMKLPLISKEPYVVDFLTYKRTRCPMEKNYFTDGLFKAVDIYDNYGVIFKKISGQPMFVKIILSKEIIRHMKLSDILQLRITRNPSYYTWDILSLKGCFLYQTEKNINQRSYYVKR